MRWRDSASLDCCREIEKEKENENQTVIKQNTRTLETMIQFKNVNYESKYLLTEQNLMNSFQCDLG